MGVFFAFINKFEYFLSKNVNNDESEKISMIKKFPKCSVVLVFYPFLYYNVDKSGVKWLKVGKNSLVLSHLWQAVVHKGGDCLCLWVSINII